jgi:hypothetical protein
MIASYISVLLAIALIELEAWLNVRKFKQNKTINKTNRTILRGSIGVVFAVVTYYPEMLYALRYFPFLAALFLAFFNPSIALMMGQKWYYLNDTGFTDKFLRGLPLWLRIAVTLLVLVNLFIVWQVSYFSKLHIGILEKGFFNQFVQFADYLI